MNVLQNPTRTAPSKRVSHEAVLEWLTAVRAALAGHPAERLLDFEGIDAFDLLRSELYLTTLSALRNGGGTRPGAARRTVQALRLWLFDWKMWVREIWEGRHAVPPHATEVLFWPRDVTHVEVLAPVANALSTRGASCTFLACQPGTLQILTAKKFEAVFGPRSWAREIRRARREGLDRARQLVQTPPWSLPDLDHRPGRELEPILREAIGRLLPLVAATVATARRAIDETKPKLLVVGNDLTLEGRTGCRVAAQHKLPTAVFMHGTITGIPMQAEHLADRIFVYGESHRDELTSHKIDSDRIVVCGDPKFDGIARRRGVTHPALKKRFGLREGEPWILAATSGPGHRVSHEHHEQIVKNLSALAQAFPEVPILIKLHRKDRLAYYQSILKSSAVSRLHVIPYGERGIPADIFDWLKGCSVVLTGASTTAIEAMALDVPVITMDFCRELYNIDFIDAGATVHVTTPTQLAEAVRQVLSSGRLPDEVEARMRQFLKGTYFSLDGRSSERAAEALHEVANRGR